MTPLLLAIRAAAAPASDPPAAPFTGDYTWMNGQSKQKEFPLRVSDVVTLSLYLDTYYAYSANHPLDNTLTGTGSVGRHNEFHINLASVGFDWNYENYIGRIALQYGSMLTVVQELDPTTIRGSNLSTDSLKNLREATLGRHFDLAHGLNVEAGIFMSYIGLESYLLAENWSYNRSFVCESTPFYFSGVRAQFFPSATVKIEPWLMNGYQTYGNWNQAPSAGLATRWSPTEAFTLFGNFYAGNDTRGDEGRIRLHHDHSVLVRYYDAPGARGLSKAALSLNDHVGAEFGGRGPKGAYVVGAALSNRLWFLEDHLAFGVRGEVYRHPGGYTAQLPPPGFDASRGFDLYGVTGTLEFMPESYVNVRPEVMWRAASVPFFSGPGGVTSADGYQDGRVAGFVPDVVKNQLLFTLGATFRL